MQRARDPLIAEVDDWLIVDAPPGDSGFRNRFVKTSLRGLLNGPFLFLDSDIFVRGDLSEIFTFDTDIAGARNHSRQAFAEQVWEQDSATLQAMGWTIRTDVYINGGVLLWNDTPSAGRFGAEWHRRWLLSSQARRNCRDQPALNSALHATEPRLTVLSDRYNAQLKISLNVVDGASVWHYYSSACDPPHTRFEQLATDLMSGKKLRLERVARMVAAAHPWRRATSVDDWVAARVMRRGQFNEWEAAWLRRETPQYLMMRARRAMMRARQASWKVQRFIVRSLTR